MNESGFEFWRLLAGIGLFLFAMAQLESALQSPGGRSFKSFLRRFTDRPLKAVFAGTVLTALVQSSSLVGLMVLAFVGAGVFAARGERDKRVLRGAVPSAPAGR